MHASPAGPRPEMTEPRVMSSGWMPEMTRSPPGRSTRANSASTGWRSGTWTRASAQVLGRDWLVHREQPAGSLLVIAAGLLLVGGDGADLLDKHPAVPQLLVGQQPPDLGQPGLGEFTVMIPGPGIQERDALEAEQKGKRVLIDHGADLSRGLSSRCRFRTLGAASIAATARRLTTAAIQSVRLIPISTATTPARASPSGSHSREPNQS
jgi:hypothetical protein